MARLRPREGAGQAGDVRVSAAEFIIKSFLSSAPDNFGGKSDFRSVFAVPLRQDHQDVLYGLPDPVVAVVVVMEFVEGPSVTEVVPFGVGEAFGREKKLYPIFGMTDVAYELFPSDFVGKFLDIDSGF